MLFKRCYILFCFLFLIFQVVPGQNTFRLRGRVTDKNQEQPVENATIAVGKANVSLVTDKTGAFSCYLEAGVYQLIIRHVGYEERHLSLSIRRDTTIEIQLVTASHLLSESTVRQSRRVKGISGLMGGRVELNMEQLAALPKFIGANDPLKILQLTPGVQTAGEGNSGLFIRGGEPGHNLIVWNEAPVYNASHLLGSFSIFNTGHIGSFKLHKSNMGAEYGGRLSALIEVESPDRIPDRFSVSGDVGVIFSQVTMAIPFKKKSALYLSGRKTYVGLLLKPLLEASLGGKAEEMPFDYEFQDANLTFVHRPDERNKIVLNAYWGSDGLTIGDPEYLLDGTMKWSNLAASLLWERKWGEAKRLKNVLFMSRYQNKLSILQNGLSVNMPSSIRDCGYKNEFNLKTARMAFKTGAEYTFHTIAPQEPQIKVSDDLIGNSGQQIYHTHNLALFLSGDFSLTENLSAEIGLRYACNFQTGPYDDTRYNSQGEISGTTHYGRGESVSFDDSFEPRVALCYSFPDNGVLQFSYNRHKQFINLVSISGVGFPTDFWVPSSRNIPAQTGDNLSAGYFRSLWNNDYEFSVEGYYRWMGRQMEYNNALFDLFNQQYIMEQSIAYGKGKAYGAEFMFKKNSGDLTGWISYTLGKSGRNFPEIQDDRGFPAKHDRRHDLSLVVAYKLNKRWDFSSVFVYATGNAFTMPTGIYTIGGNVVKEYGPYNGSRMPAYHRLDLSANYWFFKGKNRESGLNFSVYNVYKRNNPLYVFIVAKPGKQENRQISIKKKQKQLYDIIPSISWTFKF